MVLKYHISPAPLLMEDMVVKIYEAGSVSPGAEVYTQVIAQAGGGGHPNPTTITATGLDMVVHIVRLYSAISNILLHSYSAEPKIDGVTVFDPIYFKIGDGNLYTPLAGSNSYTNPLLVGLQPNEYLVHRNNYGYLFPEGANAHRINDANTGTFTLLGDDEFNAGEEFVIQRASKVVTNLFNEGVINKWFNGFLDISVDTDYINAHLRKLVRFSGSVGYYFRPLAAIPIGYVFCFTNLGAGASNSISTVHFENAPLIWNNTTRGFIDLPLFTEGAFVFDGTNWNVVYITDTRWQASSVPLSNSILGSGSTAIADIPINTDVLYTVTHGLNISGDYRVFLSIQSNGTGTTANRDNDVQLAWYHHATDKPNKFHFMVGDAFSGVQSATINWLLIKT